MLDVRELGVRAGARELLRGVSFEVVRHEVFGIIGPSGGGKSTLLRAMNRLTDLTGLKVTGDVVLHGSSIFASGTDVDALRARVGMLFQQPVIFPTSIRENVLFGAKRLRRMSRADEEACVERSLREASLWEEVKDRLKAPAMKLSVGQQQRLCLARTLATEPEVILMDEPTSALDPRSTEAIEGLVRRLRETHTIVLVTHNLRQARELADRVAFVGVRDGVGQLLCGGTVSEVLDNTRLTELDEYVCCQ
ncbi:ATP-binding cassette domain-containing protein [Phragmitibacter flavus]|uniref:ATP-binding cassette domain-containing protein n=2 Tax=Phragmitibacter flavus TaxID=2576071 RepID=A0A5R8KE29_9BACT|nr:ATP-binding cassette domain-containing protein [Phragmitibacter flavus]